MATEPEDHADAVVATPTLQGHVLWPDGTEVACGDGCPGIGRGAAGGARVGPLVSARRLTTPSITGRDFTCVRSGHLTMASPMPMNA
jgi:hypothetical protein